MKQPVYYPPYPLASGQWAHPQPVAARTDTKQHQQSNRTHLLTGLVAGVAITYLLTNRQVQKGLSSTASKAWGSVRGEVEELKERLADVQAELDYYRHQQRDTQ